MGLAQCRTAASHSEIATSRPGRLIANRAGGNYTAAPAFSFNLESHRALRLQHSRLSAPIARLLYRVTPV